MNAEYRRKHPEYAELIRKNDHIRKIANAIFGEYRKNYPDRELTNAEIADVVIACTEFTDFVKDEDVLVKVADSVGKNNGLCHFEDVATLHPDANVRDATHREIKEILEGIAVEADNGKHWVLSPQELADKVLAGDLAKYYFNF